MEEIKITLKPNEPVKTTAGAPASLYFPPIIEIINFDDEVFAFRPSVE